MLHVIRHIPLCRKHLAILYWVTKGTSHCHKTKNPTIFRTLTRHIATQYIVTCKFMWTPHNLQSSLLPKIPFSKCKEMPKIPPQPPPNYSTTTPCVPFLRNIIKAREIHGLLPVSEIGFNSKLWFIKSRV